MLAALRKGIMLPINGIMKLRASSWWRRSMSRGGSSTSRWGWSVWGDDANEVCSSTFDFQALYVCLSNLFLKPILVSFFSVLIDWLIIKGTRGIFYLVIFVYIPGMSLYDQTKMFLNLDNNWVNCSTYSWLNDFLSLSSFSSAFVPAFTIMVSSKIEVL